MANPLPHGPTVTFKNVSLTLGGNSILDDVSFKVDPGTIHCIIGPNGGGKTSLIRCLLGQMPHKGKISIRWGHSWTLGYVPQALDFDDTLPLTVKDFMTLVSPGRRPAFLGMRSDMFDSIKASLKRVGMDMKMSRPFGSLSGGERQRVLLAQALLPRPQLLVLDEPATGLDKSGSVVMHEIIQELADAGTTILIIHHDLGIVREIAHGVTCINREVYFTGAPRTELTPERIFSIFSQSTKVA